MPAPEINVRLTADGVQDVVNAFRRVQQESKKTAEGVGVLDGPLEKLDELLPVLSIALVVDKMVEFGKSTLESAINLGHLAEETGASAGTLSVLAMASRDVDVSQEQLQKGLVQLSRQMQYAVDGQLRSKEAFQNLGITIDDIRKKDPASMFLEVAKRLQAMPDGALKSATAMQLFERSGAELIPVLNRVGKAGGFEEAKQRAQELGLYLSDGLVADAKQAEEAMAQMKDVTRGFALQFMAGFIPEATEAITDFTKAVSGEGTDSIKMFGNFVGNVVRGIVNVFLVAGQLIKALVVANIDEIETLGKTASAVLNNLAHGNFSGAWDSLKGGASGLLSGQAKIWSQFGSTVASEYTSEPTTPTLPKGTGGGTGAGGTGNTSRAAQKAEQERRKMLESRAAYEESLANSELQKQKLLDQHAEAEDKARYDAGLETLDEYYDARAERINAESDAEIATLKTKMASQVSAAAQLLGKSQEFIQNLIGQGPKAIEAAAGKNTQALAMLQKIAQTQAQMGNDEITRQTKLQENETQREQARKQANAQALSDRQKLYELEGKTTAAQQVALEKELQDTSDLLTRLGVAEGDRQAILDRVRANATAKNQMGALSQSGSAAFTSLQTATSAIQNRASAGTISELNAEAQIYTLEKERLPVLQSIAQRMQDVVGTAKQQLANLSPGTDEYNAQLQLVENLQKQADEYAQKVASLNVSLQSTGSFAVELSNQLSQRGAGAFVSFFDAIDTGSKSASSAFADLGKDFEQMITHMIDQMIVYYAMLALVGWIAPNSSLMTSLKASSPFSGLTGHQEGGYTGTAPTNRIAGFVHGQEYVFTAAATKKWGLPLLEAMNAGTVSSVASGSTYSSLGSISGGGAGDGNGLVQVNVTNNTGQPASTNQRSGPGGQSIIDVVVGQVASDIAAGGKVGQTIQSTFGVSRKGIIRG